uniref:Uncharacterized protein n=1 Tax=Mesocestoides corti TaxID=53468 RepID=A0A5K3FND4_MESCO
MKIASGGKDVKPPSRRGSQSKGSSPAKQQHFTNVFAGRQRDKEMAVGWHGHTHEQHFLAHSRRCVATVRSEAPLNDTCLSPVQSVDIYASVTSVLAHFKLPDVATCHCLRSSSQHFRVISTGLTHPIRIAPSISHY